jgi:ABC-type transport system involved in cytochrome c biogenesis permease subunit
MPPVASKLFMPILWLRAALCCYTIGLIYALLALTRTSSLLNRVAVPAMSLGMVFQFVSLTEAVLLSGQLTLTSVHNSESLLSLTVMAAFMIVYLVYRTTSPGIVVFPLVFVLTFVAATTQQPFLLASPGMRRGWLFVHIAMIFVGYAALFLSFAASLLYLLQERSEVEKAGCDSVAAAGARSD